MNIEKIITDLVSSTNSLTQAVLNKMKGIDEATERNKKAADAAIAKLNGGSLDSLILTKNMRGLDLSQDVVPYRRFTARYDGDGDSGTDRLEDLVHFGVDYDGIILNINLTSYSRGYAYGGIVGKIIVRGADHSSNPNLDVAIMSDSEVDVRDYFVLCDENGTALVKDANSGRYRLPRGSKFTLKVLVKKYNNVMCVADKLKL